LKIAKKLIQLFTKFKKLKYSNSIMLCTCRWQCQWKWSECKFVYDCYYYFIFYFL